uniref:Uncharacterized protein n=1 Tax=Vitis vinifera TaxID=29760 RepID=A5AQD3_VITVI|nr:hypothetical protein VITISV_005098 [Vitis vinifera]
MEETKTMKTPMSSSVKLATDEKGRGRITKRGNVQKKKVKSLTALTRQSTGPRPVDSRLKALDWIFGKFGGEGFGFRPYSLTPTRHNQLLLHFRAPRVSVGPSSQSSFIEPSHIEIPPHQAPHAPDHAHWMDLSTQISSLGTLMEELAVVNDNRFYSMEDRMYQYQAGFTSPFERLEYRMDQHQADFTL